MARRARLAETVWIGKSRWAGKLWIAVSLAAAVGAGIAVGGDAIQWVIFGVAVGLTMLAGLVHLVRRSVFGKKICFDDAAMHVGRRRLPYADIERIIYSPLEHAGHDAFEHAVVIHASSSTIRLVAPDTIVDDIETAFAPVEKANPRAVVGPDLFAEPPSSSGGIEVGGG